MLHLQSQLSRRLFLGGALAIPMIGSGLSDPGATALTMRRPERPVRAANLTARLRQLEQQYSARVGVAVIEPTSGRRFSHRGNERFALCSTFKTYAVASVLHRFLEADPDLAEPTYIDPADLVVNSPQTSAAAGTTVTLGWLCQVALTHSDNTAGNYLLRKLGGPASVAEFARAIGDTSTRLDRWEPELNTAYRDDPRDTSTPSALAAGNRRILLGGLLTVDARHTITEWMKANVTSGPRMRAGLPAGWTSADKTGGGDFGTLNDVGVAWDPSGRPLVLSILTDTATGQADAPRVNELIADVTATTVEFLH